MCRAMSGCSSPHARRDVDPREDPQEGLTMHACRFSDSSETNLLYENSLLGEAGCT